MNDDDEIRNNVGYDVIRCDSFKVHVCSIILRHVCS
jgi:hypothetical protein